MLPDSLAVHHELPARRVHIDVATVANLELLSPLEASGVSGASRRSLFGLLNKTVTKGGGASIAPACMGRGDLTAPAPNALQRNC